MSSLTIKIPINIDATDGFKTIKDFNSLVKQNLKMIILTNPGERIMEPTYGVGASAYLFNNFNDGTIASLKTQIIKQTGFYLPAVSITNIRTQSENIDNGVVKISIEYSIPQLGVNDSVVVTI